MTATATETLVELLAQKANIKTAMDNGLAALNHEIASIECVLDMLNPVDQSGEPVHGVTKPDDIRDCKTHMAAATLMAVRNQGVVRVTPAAKVIKAADLSDAKAGSIAATLHNRMTTSKEWEYVEPGTFRWTQYKEPAPPSIKPPENAVRDLERNTRAMANLVGRNVAPPKAFANVPSITGPRSG